MSIKRLNILKRFIGENNLELVECGTADTRWFAIARAKNGNTQKFNLSKKEGDIRGDLNEAARIKRFAQYNDVAVEVPGVNHNPLITVANTLSVPVMDKGRKVLRAVVPMTPEQQMANALAEEEARNNHEPQKQEQPVTQDPKTEEQKPAEEQPKKAGGQPQQNRLTQVKFYQMTKVMEPLDTTKFDGMPALAEHMTKLLGFRVNKSNVEDALKILGKTTKQQQARLDNASKPAKVATTVQTLARCLVTLFEHLGEPVPPELRKIAK